MRHSQRDSAFVLIACLLIAVVLVVISGLGRTIDGASGSRFSPTGDPSFQDRAGSTTGPVMAPGGREDKDDSSTVRDVPGASLRPLFDAMFEYESELGEELFGDDGTSRGPYHIGRAYWQDACEYGGQTWIYEMLVDTRFHSETVMVWYWMRYGATTDEERMALHVAGPTGIAKMKSSKLIQEYISRVKGKIK